MTETRFTYNVCLSIAELDELSHQQISIVQFDSGRYGAVKHALTFNNPINGLEVIKKVEEWLSCPLTQEEYANLVRHKDLFFNPEQRAFEKYKCRGDALTDCIFLEVADYHPDSQLLSLICGS